MAPKPKKSTKTKIKVKVIKGPKLGMSPGDLKARIGKSTIGEPQLPGRLKKPRKPKIPKRGPTKKPLKPNVPKRPPTSKFTPKRPPKVRRGM